MHGSNSLKRAAGRFGIVFVLGLILAVTVNAYTVVMRGGRHVEVPSKFVVTASTLTYEVSPGVQVSLSIAAIDIPATEKANNEAAGSFMMRLQSAPAEAQTTDKSSSQPRRTITNRDLESAMRRRRDSEQAYETRRKELGLPSVEESRKQAEAEAESIRIELEQKRMVTQQSEGYWRERATALRTEISAVDAELAYVRSRLDEGPLPNNWSSGWSSVFFTTRSMGLPFGNFGGRTLGHPGGLARFPSPRSGRPNIYLAPRGPSVSARVNFGGSITRGQVFPNPGAVHHPRPGGSRGFPPHLGSRSVVVGSWGFPDDYSYERGALITRFNELGATRAGLNARWRELEDEARRAGAPPGWLRP